jgi:hypothetical protein
MKRSEVMKELLSAYCQREGKRVGSGDAREICMKARKIISFFEKEEKATIKK